MISFVDSMAAPLSLLNALILAVGRQRKEETCPPTLRGYGAGVVEVQYLRERGR